MPNTKGQIIKGERYSPRTEFKKGLTPWNKGIPHSKKTKNKISQKNKGKHFSPKTEFKRELLLGKPRSEKTKQKMSESIQGTNHWNWKGGITPIRTKLYFSKEYKLWREATFKRDNYTCIWCGQKGGELNADHIKPWSLFPELRFAIDNGRTLCVPCHRKTDTYGGHKKNGFF